MSTSDRLTHVHLNLSAYEDILTHVLCASCTPVTGSTATELYALPPSGITEVSLLLLWLLQ